MKHKLKHFIATHTFHSAKSKKDFFSLVKHRKTNSDWFGNETAEMKENFFKLLKSRNLLDDDNITEKNSDDYALLLQLFIGRGEFFFCHWFAESEDAIHEALEISGDSDVILTVPYETQRYISSDAITDRALVNLFE